jgi:hypothetical protein
MQKGSGSSAGAPLQRAEAQTYPGARTTMECRAYQTINGSLNIQPKLLSISVFV